MGCTPCRKRKKKWIQEAKEPQATPRAPLSPPKIWACGVQTAPRKQYTLARCVKSLRGAGWEDILICAEPGSDLYDLGDATVIQHDERKGAWHNFVYMARELLRRNPDADSILTVQDDTEFSCGIVEYLRDNLWPSADCGCVTLYTASQYSYAFQVETPTGRFISSHTNLTRASAIARRRKAVVRRYHKQTGLHALPMMGFWGACALAWPRKALEEFLDHPRSVNWNGVRFKTRTTPREPWEVANVDAAVGGILKRMNLKLYGFTPSLADHFADVSTIGHGGKGGRRSASDFRGPSVSAAEVFQDVLPQRPAYDETSPPVVTDDEFDNFADEWSDMGNRVSTAISQPLWSRIRRYLKPGMKTLEFGSGLSTMLFNDYDVDHTAIEQSARWAKKVHGVTHVPLDSNGWYDWEPDGPYDLILLDGPYKKGREGILRILHKLFHDDTIMFIDDFHREDEKYIASSCNRMLSLRSLAYDDYYQQYALVANAEITKKAFEDSSPKAR